MDIAACYILSCSGRVNERSKISHVLGVRCIPDRGLSLYGKHYLLKGDHEVKIPTSVKLWSLAEGRKAAKADDSPFSFGAVRVPPKYQGQPGVIYM